MRVITLIIIVINLSRSAMLTQAAILHRSRMFFSPPLFIWQFENWWKTAYRHYDESQEGWNYGSLSLSLVAGLLQHLSQKIMSPLQSFKKLVYSRVYFQQTHFIQKDLVYCQKTWFIIKKKKKPGLFPGLNLFFSSLCATLPLSLDIFLQA